MFNLEQLRSFVAVAEHLHFGRAAQELQMTQPPLSRQIQKLEADLGVQLFERTKRKVELTAAGTVFLERARRILVMTERSREAVRGVALGEAGRLTIGFTASSALSVLGPLLERVSAALPEAAIDLRERVSGAQLTEIERGSIDLAIVRSVPADPNFGVRELFREDLVVALPDGHPLAKADRACRVEQLSAYPVIGYALPESEYFYRRVEQIFAERRVRYAYSVSQILSMLSMVSSGFGIALVPRSAKKMRTEGVTYRDLLLPPNMASAAQVTISAVWSNESQNPVLWRALSVLQEG